MAFSDPGAVSGHSTGTSTWANAVRNSLLATGVAQVSAEGDLVIGTGSQAVTRLAAGTQHGALRMGAARPQWQIEPAVRVYLGSAFDPAVGSWDDVEFDSERWDANAMHSTVTNPERLTIPASADGFWIVGGFAEFATGDSANDNSVVGVRLLLNGTTDMGGPLTNTYRAEDKNLRLPVSSLWDVNASDYVTLQVFTDRNINILTAELWAIFQRPA